MTDDGFSDQTEMERESLDETVAAQKRMADRFVSAELAWDATWPLDKGQVAELRRVMHVSHLCDGAELPISRLVNPKSEVTTADVASSPTVPTIGAPPGLSP